MSNEPGRATEPMDPPAHALAADLAWLTPGARAGVGAIEGRAGLLGRAMVRAAAIATSAGAEVVGCTGTDVLDVVGPGGPVRIVVLPNAFPARLAGAPGDVARLVDAVAGALGEWRFMLHIQREVPAAYDPDPVGKAVALWRASLERGEWKGKNAVYEDDDVSIELSVTARSASGGAIGVIGPMPAPDRLLGVYSQVRTRIDVLVGEAPFVLAVSAEPRWSVPRGYVLDLLYGSPDVVVADSNGWTGVFARRHPALLGDKRIGAMWWIDSAPDALGFRAIGYESPWRPPSLTFPGTRFSVTDASFARAGSRQKGRDLVAVHQSGRDPTEWRLR